MIPVGGDRQAVLLTPQLLPPKLAKGGQVQALVLGSNRHGVSIQIGRETFQLSVASSLAKAKTLTLQGAGSSADKPQSGGQVKVVAADDRPLAQAVSGDLARIQKPTSPAASAIVQTNRLDVPAQPLNAKGQAVGATVILRLQAMPIEVSASKPVAQPAALASSAASKVPAQPFQTPTVTQAPAKASSPSVPAPKPDGSIFQQETGAKPILGDDVAKPSPVPEGQAKVNGSQPNLPSQASVAPTSVAGPQARVVSAPQVDVTAAPQRLAAGEPASPTKVEPSSLKGLVLPAVSTNRDATVQPPAPDSKSTTRPTPPTIEPQITTNRETRGAAVVIEQTRAGKVILETEGQLFRVEKPLDLPLGMTLQATLAPGASALSPLALPDGNRDLATPLSKLVQLLDDIDRAAQQTVEPDQPALSRQLPLPDKNLASRFLNLLTTQDGDLHLDGQGQPSERAAMTATQREQIQSLVRDIGNTASEPLAEGWKSQALPLGSDQSQAVSLFYRDQDIDPDEDSSEDETEHSKTQRAVFDVTFSRLGRCQVDTLCQERRFDLVIRSEKPLPSDDRQQITVLFTSASEIAGLHGDIAFKAGSFFEPPRSPIAAQDIRT